MTKILFVTKHMMVGGIEKSLINLCNILTPDNFDVTVLILSSSEGISNELPAHVKRIFVSRKKTISFDEQYNKFWCNHYDKIVSCTFNQKYPIVLRLFLYRILCFEAFSFRKYTKKLFSNEQFDICVGYSQGEASDIAANCINAKIKYLFFHSGKITEFINDLNYYAKADIIIAVSEGVKKELIAKRNLNKDKVIVLHNIYNVAQIVSQSHYSCEFDNISKLKIATVARISSEKGILQAISSARILKDNGLDFIWYFVGPDNNGFMEICKEAVKTNNLEKTVHFTGLKSNPFPYIRSADIYVQPSEFEALPGTVAEAIILGKLIVSTQTYGAKELLTNDENGILCGFEAKDIANAILTIENNKQLKEKIINNLKNSSIEFENEKEKYINLFTFDQK